MKLLADQDVLNAIHEMSFEELARLCNESNKVYPWDFVVAQPATVTINEARKKITEALGISQHEMAKGMHAHDVNGDLVIIFDVDPAQMVVTIPAGYWHLKADLQIDGRAIQ